MPVVTWPNLCKVWMGMRKSLGIPIMPPKKATLDISIALCMHVMYQHMTILCSVCHSNIIDVKDTILEQGLLPVNEIMTAACHGCP